MAEILTSEDLEKLCITTPDMMSNFIEGRREQLRLCEQTLRYSEESIPRSTRIKPVFYLCDDLNNGRWKLDAQTFVFGMRKVLFGMWRDFEVVEANSILNEAYLQY